MKTTDAPIAAAGPSGPGPRIGAIALMIAAALLAGCMRPRPIAAPPGVEVTPIRTISTVEARVLLLLTGVRGVTVSYPADCYRMIYEAPGKNGTRERQSALVALPRGAAPRRVAAFLHGTTTTPSAVPSRPDGTGLAAAIVFAGSGYALVAPDYPGLGVSPGPHPYYVTEAIAPSVVAAIDAAQTIAGTRAPVFLSGHSEGGWATMAALEAQGRPVFAAAPVAGAFDLVGVSVPAALKGGAASHALYMAYAAWGQSAWYGRRLDSALRPEQAATVERLFNGASPREIIAGLPADPRALFTDDFLAAADGDGAHWLLDRFTEHSVVDVTPRAPVRMYYGSEDKDVVPAESIAAAHAMRARGADVTAVNVGPVGHDPSMLAAAPLILAWLRDLEAGTKDAPT
jgi:hypothetical protein